MHCVTIALFSVLINEEIGNSFAARKGLRQNCPISSFLFILCAEGLSSFTTGVIYSRKIYGLKVARVSPVISHLFFVDNSPLFPKVI